MNIIKSVLAASILAGTASAHAALFNITGTLDSAVSSNSGVLLNLNSTPFNSVLPTSVPSNTPIAISSGQLDITGTTINSGTLTMPNYGLFASLAGPTLNYYVVMDVLGTGYNFGPGVGSPGANWDATGPLPTNCTGPGTFAVCPSLAAVKPEISYVLSSTGANTYHLTLVNGDAASSSTFNFSLTATPAAVPVPTAAWLFGSGLLGLAGAARRRRTV